MHSDPTQYLGSSNTPKPQHQSPKLGRSYTYRTEPTLQAPPFSKNKSNTVKARPFVLNKPIERTADGQIQFVDPITTLKPVVPSKKAETPRRKNPPRGTMLIDDLW